MTPERAGEIATEFRRSHGLSSTADCPIRLAILQACAEERAACAKKCDAYADERRAMQKKTAESYYEGAADAADELGTAIRGAE